MDSSIVIPITLWSSSLTTPRLSVFCVTPNVKNIITGSCSGQLCIWNLDIDTREIVPQSLLIGHKYSITCMVSTNEFIISASDGGEMFRWHLEDGYCDKTKNLRHIHRNMQLLKKNAFSDELLFTCGEYLEIFIYNSRTLQKISKLLTKSDCYWMSNFHALQIQSDNIIKVTGITSNGCVKNWLISSDPNRFYYENIVRNVEMEKVVDLKYNSNNTKILIVTLKYWCIYDIDFIKCECKIKCPQEEKLSGGIFNHLNVIVWTDFGKFYLYEQRKDQLILKSILENDNFKRSLFKPAITVLDNKKGEMYFFRGDSSTGQINIWIFNIPDNVSAVPVFKPLISSNLNENWENTNKGVFDNIVSSSSVTCCIYVFELDKFFLGSDKGKIIILPGLETIMSFYFCSPTEAPPFDILSGHKGKINCLMYPHSKYSHYSKSHLVSGSNDFSVCLWDIFTLELLHRFCVQSGEILKLLLPPKNSSSQIKQSICSISSDHSVAVLNLTDRRCVILTASHLFPVVTVNWKPLDGFLIIECFDGTVYVWETETGFLDRVLDGVVAQEVIYACRESNISSNLNFYTCDNLVKKNSLKREMFQINSFPKCAFEINGFLTSNKSESLIMLCNLEDLINKAISSNNGDRDNTDFTANSKFYFLTQILSLDLMKKTFKVLNKSKCETNDSTEETISKIISPEANLTSKKREEKINNSSLETLYKFIKFFLSSLHIWNVDLYIDDLIIKKLGFQKPTKPIFFGVVSSHEIYSLFLPDCKTNCQLNPSVLATICIFMTALSSIFNSSSSINLLESSEVKNDQEQAWNELFRFYESICLGSDKKWTFPRPKIEILAKGWQSKCINFRKVVRKILRSYLDALAQEDQVSLLQFWYKHLPHFRFSAKTPKKSDYNNIDLSMIALILFGTVGSDLKFKANYLSCQENYVYQTCASFVYLLLLSTSKEKCIFDNLKTIAIDFIGQGYIVWEQFLKIEKICPILFEMCENRMKNFTEVCDEPFNICISAHNALKAIALARTSAFIKCLIDEINRNKPPNSFHGDNFSIDQSKPEIISILTFLLEKTPYIMLLYLNEVISLFLFCIDLSHWKQENLSDLVPITKKFRQIHHCQSNQKIAVGLGTGAIVVHDIKSKKAVTISAHKDSVSAIKFSDDGKYLVSYSCYENRITFWQVLTGMFGLGQVQIKCVKSYQTCRIHDEEIRNHLEIAELAWQDSKSAVLNLFDGTNYIFHL